MRGTALAFRFLIVGSILTSPVARPAETALRVSEGWTATPLTTDSPQSPILQFGDQFSLPSGELVFWGRIRDGRDGWALFSLRADRLRTILVEGESSVSRYGEPNARLHLHYRGTEMLHRPTRIFAGRVLVISTEEAIGNGGSVYAWDGDRLRGALVEGERTTIGGGGVIAGAFAWAASGDGQVLLTVRTRKPDPYSAWALFDGRQLRLLARSGEALPGLPGFRVAGLCVGGSGSVCKIWLFDGDQVLADLGLLQGAVETQAIVRLSPGGAERLLGPGDPLPADPSRTIDRAFLEAAESPRSFVARLLPPDPNWKGGAREVTYARCEGGLCSPSSLEIVKASRIEGTRVPWRGASLLRWSGDWRRDGNRIIGRRDLDAVQGGESVRLTPANLLLDDRATIRRVEGDFPGAIVEGSYWDAAAAKDGYVDTDRARPSPGRWFVAADDLAAGLQPLPVLRTLDGRSATLAEVLTWNGGDRVIARFADGLYRLDKAPQQPSP